MFKPSKAQTEFLSSGPRALYMGGRVKMKMFKWWKCCSCLKWNWEGSCWKCGKDQEKAAIKWRESSIG